MKNSFDINSFDFDSIAQIDFDLFYELLKFLLNNPEPPEESFFLDITQKANNVLITEDEVVRPHDNDNRPGGLINVITNDVIIVPDLHARRFFLKDLLIMDIEGKRAIDLLEDHSLSIVCVGDGVHGEANYSHRWRLAYKEFIEGYNKCPNMDEEIADSFNLMLCIMCLKIRYSDNLHFLKGNHENIYNETGNGNFSFAKYANEGAMVVSYFSKFYSETLLDEYAAFEKNLPLFAVGKNFLISHAEPEFFFERIRIINYRGDEELIEALTWTDNDSSIDGSVEQLLDYYTHNEKAYYFGGHRPIIGAYRLVNHTRYIQIHNPKEEIVVHINQDDVINLDQCVQILSESSYLKD